MVVRVPKNEVSEVMRGAYPHLPSGKGKQAMSPAIDNYHFGSDTWNVAFYDVMSGLARTTRAAHEKAKQVTRVIAFHAQLWSLERDLRVFVEFLKHPENGYKGSRGMISEEPVCPADVADGLVRLSKSLNGLHESCKRSGWTNRAMTGASLAALHNYADFMEDYGEMMLIATDPGIEQHFESARQQYLNGETVGLEAINLR
jgi:hypothetical protein